MRRLWPYALLLLPALGMLGRVDPMPTRPPHASSPIPGAAIDADEIQVHQPSPPTAKTPFAKSPADSLPAAPRDSSIDAASCSWEQSPTIRSVVRLAYLQNPDGSWGDVPEWLDGQLIGKPAITALAVMTYAAGCYSHLSQDSYEGRNLGTATRTGLEWMIRNLRDDGTLKTGTASPLEQILVATALSELYGRTETAWLKDPARRAVQGMLALPDWGAAGSTAWALEGLVSALDGDLIRPTDFSALVAAIPELESHPSELYRAQLLKRDRRELEAPISRLIATPPHPSELSTWYHASRSMRFLAGRHSVEWDQWAVPLKANFTSGIWPGATTSQTVIQSTLATMTLFTHYDPNPSVFGPRR